MSRAIDLTTSFVAGIFRGGRGALRLAGAKEPEHLLELYDFEACPYCRLVREALTELDLDAMIYPCPRGGTRFRPKVVAMGGKAQFPYLVDPNTGRAMYESAAIVEYLYATYAGRRPFPSVPRPLDLVASAAASAVRGLRGRSARPSRPAAEPLELYSFDASPFSRLVREVLCELEIPYRLRSFGKGSLPDWGAYWTRTVFFPNAPVKGRNRIRMRAMDTGRLQVPYLVDPNTGIAMYESAEIVRYLEATYGGRGGFP